MQRLHEDDLVGHILGGEDWEVLSLPAIAEQDEAFAIEPYTGVGNSLVRSGKRFIPSRSRY
jgi:hypothetical protein